MAVRKKKHWQLTPHEPRGCWKKKRNGKTLYVGYGTTAYSEADYQRAWAEWEAVLAGLEARERGERLADGGLARMLAVVAGGGLPGPEELERIGLPVEPRMADLLRRRPGDCSPDDLGYLMRAAGVMPPAEAGARPVYTVAQMAEKFLAAQRQQAKKEQKSVGRFATLKTYVNRFRDFVGGDRPVTAVDAVALADYHQRQLELIDDGNTSWTGRDRMQVARQFIRYCWELGTLELPRNIDSRSLVISCTAGDVEPMPVESLRQRVRAAAGRLKAELLLMANCGFYQVDCADLRHGEVDWAAGTIRRKRSKTRDQKNAPTVTWHLWPTTLDLLRRHANDRSDFVLATRDGQQTVREGFNEAGEPVRTDATGQAYRKMQAELVTKLDTETVPTLAPEQVRTGLEGGVLEELDGGRVRFRRWPLMSIRKTSSTVIGNSGEYSRFAQYFLGQAPTSVADGHYVRPSQEQFRECCRWLGRYLELDEAAKIADEGSSGRPDA